MDQADILQRLAAEIPGCSKRQKSLAQYIYGNCDKAAFMTADMLAEAAGVSESSVVRFARQLGYDGFSELRRALQSVLRRKLSAAADEVRGDMERLRAEVTAEGRSLQSILCGQNERCFDSAVRALRSAGGIAIQGQGELSGLAQYMAALLKTMGCRAEYLPGEWDASLLLMGQGDAYVSLGSGLYSGRTAALRCAGDRGAETLLISDEEPGPDAEYARHRLYAKGDAAVLCVIRALAAALGRDAGLSPEQGLKELEEKRREYQIYEHTES